MWQFAESFYGLDMFCISHSKKLNASHEGNDILLEIVYPIVQTNSVSIIIINVENIICSNSVGTRFLEY